MQKWVKMGSKWPIVNFLKKKREYSDILLSEGIQRKRTERKQLYSKYNDNILQKPI